MLLLVVRHGLAEERDSTRWADDRGRPLSAAGRRRTREVALGLARLAPVPRLVLSSPLARARATAAILERDAGWPRAQPLEALAPGHDPESLLRLLRARAQAPLALVGHEPELGALLALCLATGVRVELKKAACAALEFPGRVRAGQATLVWLAPPRLLRATG